MSNTFKTAMLLGVLSGLLLLIGEALGGAQGLVLGFMFAVVTNFVSYWFSDKIVLRMYSAREADPDSRLTRIVTRLAQKAGLPQPRCYIRWPFRARGNTTPTRGAPRLPARPTDWPARWPSLTRRRRWFRSTPTPRPPTCSSSNRSPSAVWRGFSVAILRQRIASPR